MTDTNIKPNNVTTNEPEDDGSKSEKKKSTKAKYILYIAFVLISTGLALFFSLYQDFFGVMEVLLDTNLWGLLLIIFVASFFYSRKTALSTCVCLMIERTGFTALRTRS